MKKLLTSIFLTILFFSFSQENLKTGDIIFQTSFSGQSQAIQLATKSPYSHCGIVVVKEGKVFVLEAVQPVKLTPFNKWITQGDKKKWVAKRLINADSVLTENTIKKMLMIGKSHLGKNYDITFNWSDKEIYCSELVWKVYNTGANRKLCKLHPLKSYDLTHPIVQKILKQRYGNKIPYNENMVSPGDIFNSKLLVEVKKH